MSISVLLVEDCTSSLFNLLNQLSPSQLLTKQLCIQYLQQPHKRSYVYKCSTGEIIGFISFLIEMKLSRGGVFVAHIEDLIVDFKHRGKGIGSELLTFAIKHVPQNCYKIILNAAEHNHSFYTKHGFRLTEKQYRLDNNT